MTPAADDLLTAAEAAATLRRDGWRLLLGGAHTSVAASSPSAAVEIVAAAVQACGDDAAHLRAELSSGRVDLTLRTPGTVELTRLDALLAARVSIAIAALGATTTPAGAGRPAQALEIAIDALDAAAVAPFWGAVLGYTVVTRPIAGGEETVVVDPAGHGPTIWFQQLDAPRPQRNRIHLDVTVAEDEADARVTAALAAGGTMVSGAQARAFWVLADPEGNEVCVCTWQDRD